MLPERITSSTKSERTSVITARLPGITRSIHSKAKPGGVDLGKPHRSLSKPWTLTAAMQEI
jgi:hypothetical protein